MIMGTGMMPLSSSHCLFIFVPCILAVYWSSLVYRIVPEPYLVSTQLLSCNSVYGQIRLKTLVLILNQG